MTVADDRAAAQMWNAVAWDLQSERHRYEAEQTRDVFGEPRVYLLQDFLAERDRLLTELVDLHVRYAATCEMYAGDLQEHVDAAEAAA